MVSNQSSHNKQSLWFATMVSAAAAVWSDHYVTDDHQISQRWQHKTIHKELPSRTITPERSASKLSLKTSGLRNFLTMYSYYIFSTIMMSNDQMCFLWIYLLRLLIITSRSQAANIAIGQLQIQILQLGKVFVAATNHVSANSWVDTAGRNYGLQSVGLQLDRLASLFKSQLGQLWEPEQNSTCTKAA